MKLAEVNAYLDERGVAAHARPDMLVAMAALPTTPVGKIDKTGDRPASRSARPITILSWCDSKN